MKKQTNLYNSAINAIYLKKNLRPIFFFQTNAYFIRSSNILCFIFMLVCVWCDLVVYCEWVLFHWSCPNVRNRHKQFLKLYYYFYFIMANASTSSRSDFTVGGRYRLVRKIGSGSFGDIYSALNITNGEVRFIF